MSPQPLTPQELDDFLRELDLLACDYDAEMEDLAELLGPDPLPLDGETLA